MARSSRICGIMHAPSIAVVSCDSMHRCELQTELEELNRLFMAHAYIQRLQCTDRHVIDLLVGMCSSGANNDQGRVRVRTVTTGKRNAVDGYCIIAE